MKDLLGWKWTLGYVSAGTIMGSVISLVLTSLMYLLLLIANLALKIFWYIVSYYQKFQLGPEAGIIAALGLVSYVSLVYLLRYSKRLNKETGK